MVKEMKLRLKAQKLRWLRPKYRDYHGYNACRVATGLSGGNIETVQKEAQGEGTGVESGMNGWHPWH
jgi:hypothetical protein